MQVQELTSTEAKWEGVPAWKRKILEEKQRKADVAQAPQEERDRLEKEAAGKLASMPEWKRRLVLKKQGKI